MSIQKHSQGFTLVELMITVAIVAILSVVAVFSYKRYMRRARATEGIAFLMDIKMKQETYFSTYSQYVDTGNLVTDFYPASSQFIGSGKEGLAFWNWDCTVSPPPNVAVRGLCALGLSPTGEVIKGQEANGYVTYFQFVTIGWEPGDGPPPVAYIADPSHRWWFARARTFFDNAATMGIELRVSSEMPQVGELEFP